jgi:hypothetical protein
VRLRKICAPFRSGKLLSNRSGLRKTARTIWTIAFLISLIWIQPAVAQNKPTSLSDAQAAVEANLRTPEGKAYDEKLGTEFVQSHLGAIRQCKQSAGDDLRNLWILLKLEKDGTVKEVLLYPATKVGACAREALLKDRFAPPPRPAYWISVYMKMSR